MEEHTLTKQDPTPLKETQAKPTLKPTNMPLVRPKDNKLQLFKNQ
jgi:hypothetical protein